MSVYFIRPDGHRVVKIGTAQNVSERLEGLQSSNHLKLKGDYALLYRSRRLRWLRQAGVLLLLVGAILIGTIMGANALGSGFDFGSLLVESRNHSGLIKINEGSAASHEGLERYNCVSSECYQTQKVKADDHPIEGIVLFLLWSTCVFAGFVVCFLFSPEYGWPVWFGSMAIILIGLISVGTGISLCL